ncbi:MAG TPA: ImmA/IrrE family metallo-endopeptidase [Pyrinomonadaceae bacterium]|nr:ImmA/IrrE family metallo-endopeptidase [Pyrinomonadaceae bacterium]
MGISSLPVDPFAIANRKEITHQEKLSLEPGISGCLMKVGDVFGILYSARYANEGFKRFNVAHELGHYFLPGHIEALFGAGQLFHQSVSGFTSNDKYEREADSFAASLLMPKPLFASACRTSGQGLAAIESLADLCVTSLTATAIRFAKLCEEPVAVVCSTDDRVEFAFMSKPFQDQRGLTWIRKGSRLPSGSETANFNKDDGNIRNGKRVASTATVETWFDGGGDTKLNEEVVGLGDYGKTLTVLWADSLPEPDDDPEDAEETEDENLLPSQRWRESAW